MSETKLEEDLVIVSNQIKEILGLLQPIQNVISSEHSSTSIKHDVGINENDVALIVDKFEVLVNYAEKNVKLIKIEQNLSFHQLSVLIMVHFSTFVKSDDTSKSPINVALISKYLQILHILSKLYFNPPYPHNYLRFYKF